jgi:hypothetical protein
LGVLHQAVRAVSKNRPKYPMLDIPFNTNTPNCDKKNALFAVLLFFFFLAFFGIFPFLGHFFHCAVTYKKIVTQKRDVKFLL